MEKKNITKTLRCYGCGEIFRFTDRQDNWDRGVYAVPCPHCQVKTMVNEVKGK